MLENIIALVTIVVSFFLVKLSKKSNFVKNELIPLQNLFVGIVIAVIYYLMTKDISVAIATAGLFAGGTYDIVHNMKKMLCNKDS